MKQNPILQLAWLMVLLGTSRSCFAVEAAPVRVKNAAKGGKGGARLQPAQATRKPFTPQKRKQTTPIASILTWHGTVRVMRQGFKKPEPASYLYPLLEGDQVVVTKDSRATIFRFGDEKIYPLPVGTHRVGATRSQGVFKRAVNQARKEIVVTVQGPNGEIPVARSSPVQYCLAKIIESRPLSWGTSISLETSYGLLLNQEEADRLEAKFGELPIPREGSQSGEDARNLLLADLYALRQDPTTAIEKLKLISKTKVDADPCIQIRLGDLYLAKGDSNNAKHAYLRSIRAAQQKNSTFPEAVAQHALGFVEVLIDEKPISGNAPLQAATQLYRGVGEAETADRLLNELVQAKQQMARSKTADITAP